MFLSVLKVTESCSFSFVTSLAICSLLHVFECASAHFNTTCTGLGEWLSPQGTQLLSGAYTYTEHHSGWKCKSRPTLPFASRVTVAKGRTMLQPLRFYVQTGYFRKENLHPLCPCIEDRSCTMFFYHDQLKLHEKHWRKWDACIRTQVKSSWGDAMICQSPFMDWTQQSIVRACSNAKWLALAYSRGWSQRKEKGKGVYGWHCTKSSSYECKVPG